MSIDVEKRQEGRVVRAWDWFDMPELGRWFEGLRPWFRDEGRMRIEQELTDDSLVIRAEMPGIDPDKDVEITIEDGLLRMRAERRFESTKEETGRTRSEFSYGSFERVLRVPKDVEVEDVMASYKDGILEVRVPFKAPSEPAARKVPVTTP